jgi:uncharacterized protein
VTFECTLVCDAPAGVVTLALTLGSGATLADALELARAQLDETLLDWETARVGVWGQESSRERILASGDRVEIYRPLPNDPKLARRQRARSARLKGDSAKRPER